MCGPEASRATPGDEPALMEPRGSVGEKATWRARKRRKDTKGERKEEMGKVPREKRGERGERWMPVVVWES